MMELWSVGATQDLHGKAMDQFIKDFLELFGVEACGSIESDIKSLHNVESYRRFRRKVLVSFAIAYHNGALAQKSGKNVDVPRMIKDAIKTTQKAEGW